LKIASVAISIGIGLLVWQKLYGNKEIDEENKQNYPAIIINFQMKGRPIRRFFHFR